ncbi:Uncharacterised protein [Clostridium carnis]|uniref:Uncharacterized protein n=1 Tax=Clostridium carnis TaxID=1530 RepID=A0ABY6T0I7_9CLOT|nr:MULTISPECIES: hypothetical protein [Clostridium]VDG74560.1 Uncharacterised protein [Clostridium carnis]
MELKINKGKEYQFLEAWEKGIDDRNVIITSKSSGVSYRIDMLEKNNKLKYYNLVIDNWQPCPYIEPKEIFNTWYVTRIV